VDLFHAREHLHDLARLLEFMLGDRKDEWLAVRLEDLDHGDIDGICKAARACHLIGVKKDELDTALGYFENNAPRMRYHWFRSRGLFVGSGVVESGCKAVIDQRLKIVMHALDRRRCQRHHHAPLPAGQPPRRPDLARTAQPDTSRLTSRTR
jgi:hypothetical protein